MRGWEDVHEMGEQDELAQSVGCKSTVETYNDFIRPAEVHLCLKMGIHNFRNSVRRTRMGVERCE